MFHLIVLLLSSVCLSSVSSKLLALSWVGLYIGKEALMRAEQFCVLTTTQQNLRFSARKMNVCLAHGGLGCCPF